MAQPLKQGLQYFSLDIDFFDDEKIQAISGEFGPQGELLVIRLLCSIYRSGYCIEWTRLLRSKLIRGMRGMTSDQADEIIGRLAEYGFLDEATYRDHRVLTSRGIQRRYFEATRRRRTQIDSLPYVLQEVKNEYTQSSNMSAFTPQSKVNETKANETEGKETEAKESRPDVTEPTTATAGESRRAPGSQRRQTTSATTTDDESSALRQDDRWLSAVAQQYALTQDETLRWLDAFEAQQLSSPSRHRDTDDAKRHFANWVRKMREMRRDPTVSLRPPITVDRVGEAMRRQRQASAVRPTGGLAIYQHICQRAEQGDPEARQALADPAAMRRLTARYHGSQPAACAGSPSASHLLHPE